MLGQDFSTCALLQMNDSVYPLGTWLPDGSQPLPGWPVSLWCLPLECVLHAPEFYFQVENSDPGQTKSAAFGRGRTEEPRKRELLNCLEEKMATSVGEDFRLLKTNGHFLSIPQLRAR